MLLLINVYDLYYSQVQRKIKLKGRWQNHLDCTQFLDHIVDTLNKAQDWLSTFGREQPVPRHKNTHLTLCSCSHKAICYRMLKLRAEVVTEMMQNEPLWMFHPFIIQLLMLEPKGVTVLGIPVFRKTHKKSFISDSGLWTVWNMPKGIVQKLRSIPAGSIGRTDKSRPGLAGL